MGQSSIPMLNKVGYSMFWNSMWDNRVLYTKFIKEDLYFNDFFKLIFNDNLSINLFNLKKLKKNKYIKKNLIQFIDNTNNIKLMKYLNSNNKINYTQSKLWILKYQKWIIFYQFIYLSKFDKTFKNSIVDSFSFKSENSDIIKNYLKINNKLNNHFSYFLKINKNTFNF